MRLTHVCRCCVNFVWLIALSQMMAGCVVERSSSSALAQNRDPERFIEVNVELGMRYMQANDMPNAQRTLSRAYKANPDHPSVNNALAVFHKLQGDDEQAERHYLQALQSDPEHSQSRNNYAVFLYGEKRYEEAIVQFEQVVNDFRYPNRFQAYENLALCQLKLGRKAEAERNFNRALQLNARQPTSLLNLAQFAFDDQDYTLAQHYLDQLSLLSRSSPAQLWLGIRIQKALGNADKVASMVLALRNLYPDSPEYQAYQASLAEQ